MHIVGCVNTDALLKAQSPSELLSALPFMLGFHPADSLVVAVIEDSIIACMARIDLADARVPCRAGLLLGPFLQQVEAGGRLAIVGYGDDADEVTSVVKLVAFELMFPVFAKLVVSGGYWWHAGRPEGAEPYDPNSSRIAAEAAFRGLNARSDRKDIEGLMQRPSHVKPLQADVMQTAVRQVRKLTPQAAQQRLDCLLEDALNCQRLTLTSMECAELLVLLDVPSARDAFWLKLSRETASALVDLWLYVSWRAPADHSLGAVCAVGLAGWQSGNGALVSVALEQADRLGGWHPLWDLLTRIHGYALPPSFLDQVQTALKAECA